MQPENVQQISIKYNLIFSFTPTLIFEESQHCIHQLSTFVTQATQLYKFNCRVNQDIDSDIYKSKEINTRLRETLRNNNTQNPEKNCLYTRPEVFLYNLDKNKKFLLMSYFLLNYFSIYSRLKRSKEKEKNSKNSQKHLKNQNTKLFSS